jgi:5-formyltetrahydrofolate cyclo-ligase
LSFDTKGYRLGFGKGYYDRFLSGFEGTCVGICYENCMRESLPTDKFDICVDHLITENKSVSFGLRKEEIYG